MLFILSQFSSDFIPKVVKESNKISFVITGVLTGLIGGLSITHKSVFSDFLWSDT
jgi:hypothetical protein